MKKYLKNHEDIIIRTIRYDWNPLLDVCIREIKKDASFVVENPKVNNNAERVY